MIAVRGSFFVVVLSFIITIYILDFLIYTIASKSLSKQIQHHGDTNSPQLTRDSQVKGFAAQLQAPLGGNETLTDFLYKEVRVFCWILIDADKHKLSALHVKRTWGRRCNKLIFMSSVADQHLGSVALPVVEGRNNLWAKTQAAFKYIYAHHMNDADWFFKADDNTYAIVENLRHMLYPYSSDTPLCFGSTSKRYVKHDSMSAGSTYVLSAAAVRRFVTEAITSESKICEPTNQNFENVELMSTCLEKVGVAAGDTRDVNNRDRFFPILPEKSHNGQTVNPWRCSDYAVAFHFVEISWMYAFDFMLYTVRPYGIIFGPEQLPNKLKVGDVKPPWQLEQNKRKHTHTHSYI